MKLRLIALTGALLLLSLPARAALNVFACEPEWAALAGELGGGDVNAFSATTARQDPHQIQARPALISRLRNADLVICSGAELEVGWLPALMRQAANGKVQPGAAGYFAAAEQIKRLEIPAVVDRSMGDVHPSGNPHVQTDPRNIRAIAVALTQRLGQIDPAHASGYSQRSTSFLQLWDSAIQRWQAAAAPLKGVKAVIYHKSWAYLFDWLGMQEVATIEPKPGIPPGSAYLAQLLDDVPRSGARMILYSAYESPQASQFVADKIGIPAVQLPFTVGGNDAASDLFKLFDDTVARLNAALEKSPVRP